MFPKLGTETYSSAALLERYSRTSDIYRITLWHDNSISEHESKVNLTNGKTGNYVTISFSFIHTVEIANL